MSTTNNLGSFTTINWYFRFLTFKKKKSTLLGRLLGILYQVIRRGVNLVYLNIEQRRHKCMVFDMGYQTKTKTSAVSEERSTHISL